MENDLLPDFGCRAFAKCLLQRHLVVPGDRHRADADRRSHRGLLRKIRPLPVPSSRLKTMLFGFAVNPDGGSAINSFRPLNFKLMLNFSLFLAAANRTFNRRPP
ncbi:hypothetical protein [Sphingomonas sanxanigenens]|uniref:hypothetical protein n=1 Tax=Sphingomonas sanxanigenens TaxID=397260 RepID=UPI00138F0649|nr:hypothetical protein [Sphingomonas sanxanigenens]